MEIKIKIGRLSDQDKKDRKSYPIKISREIQITDFKNTPYNGNDIVSVCETPPSELFKIKNGELK